MELSRSGPAAKTQGAGIIAHLRGPALALLVFMFAAVGYFWSLASSARFDPPYLFLVLTIIFLGIGSFMVAGLAGRAFLRSGTWPVLLLGAGTLTLGMATLLGSALQTLASTNTAVTVFNIAAVFAGGLHLLGAHLTLSERALPRGSAGRRRALVHVYVGSLAVLAVILLVGLRGELPLFFVQGKGGTPLRQFVVLIAVVLFFSTGLIYLTEQVRTRADFLYWYALGLLMTSLGLGGVLFQTATGTPLNWAARAAQLLSGLYMLAAAWATFAEARARGLPPGAVLAGVFWRQADSMRLLFDSVTDAVIVTDLSMTVTGWNRSAQEIYGWTAEEAAGKAVDELLRTTYPAGVDRQYVRDYVAAGQVWKGELEQQIRSGHSVSILASASPLRDRNGRVTGVVSVHHDITERKRALEDARRQKAVQEGINRILQAALTSPTEQQLGETVLGVAQELTGSRFGFVGEINAQGTLDAIAISDPGWELCRMQPRSGAGMLLQNMPLQGLYGRVLRKGKAFLANDPAADPDWTGTPEGHPDLTAFLGVPLISGGKTVGMVGLGNRAGGYRPEDLAAAEALAAAVVEALQRKRAEEALRRAHDELEQRVQERTEELAASREELRAYSHRLVEAVEAERRALARELHDEAGQILTSLKIGLGLAQREPGCPPNVAERLDELKATADGLMDSLRQLAVNLRPGSLDRAGLVPAVEQYLAGYREQTGLKISFEGVGMEARLQPELETNLYRLVQEGLTNVARHAHARQVGIVLQQGDGRVRVIIEDDGVGFDPIEALHKGHLGLVGMRERAEMFGGSFDVESAPGKGTTLYVDIPLPPSSGA